MKRMFRDNVDIINNYDGKAELMIGMDRIVRRKWIIL